MSFLATSKETGHIFDYQNRLSISPTTPEGAAVSEVLMVLFLLTVRGDRYLASW